LCSSTLLILSKICHVSALFDAVWRAAAEQNDAHVVVFASTGGAFKTPLRSSFQLYDFQTEKWNAVAAGGLLGVPFWDSGSSAIYFQDQLDSEQAIYRLKIANHQVEKVFSCGEILRSSPSYFNFSALGLDGSLYVMLERDFTDRYALDLDLP